MMLKKNIGLFAALIIAMVSHAQQDAQYSQYMFNRLALNPAYAGSRDVFSTALLYRNQWTGLDGAPTTAALSMQMPLKNQKIGLGAEFFSDKLGPRSTSGVLFSYAYRLPLFTGKLAFGLRMGLMNYANDWGKLDFKDHGDIYDTPDNSSKISGTGDFGMYYYSRTFYWGFSGMHMNRGRMTDFVSDSARQAQHYYMTLGKSFKLGKAVLNPTLLLKAVPNTPLAIDAGLNILLMEKWWLGVSYRNTYGVIFISQYQISEKFRFGYSYDLGTNDIGKAGGGSHEVMIGYDINIMGAKVLPPRYF